MQVLWGVMSTNALQGLVAMLETDLDAARSGNLSRKAVRRIRRIGGSGTYRGNVWRDLQRILPDPKIPLHWMSCPFHHLQIGDFSRTLHHISFHPWVTTHKQLQKDFKSFCKIVFKRIYGCLVNGLAGRLQLSSRMNYSIRSSTTTRRCGMRWLAHRTSAEVFGKACVMAIITSL